MIFFFRITIIALILVLSGELFVRAFITLPKSTEYDKDLLWRYKPYSKVFHTSEGVATNTMNSLGFNDGEIDLKNGKHHILVLGDSFTESLQVPRSENFTTITEELTSCLDVYNAGRSGLFPVHYPYVLSRIANTFTPELAVIFISSGDMSDLNSNGYEIIRDNEENRITDIHIKQQTISSLRSKLEPILSKSALAAYLSDRLRAIINNKKPARNDNNNISLKLTKKENARIYEVLVYILRKMKSEIPIAVLYQPKLEYGNNRIASVEKRSDIFEQIIKSACNDAGIAFLSTKNYMIKSYLDSGQPGNGFPNKNILYGHLNTRGHHATALALRELISMSGLKCNTNSKSQNN